MLTTCDLLVNYAIKLHYKVMVDIRRVLKVRNYLAFTIYTYLLLQ